MNKVSTFFAAEKTNKDVTVATEKRRRLHWVEKRAKKTQERAKNKGRASNGTGCNKQDKRRRCC
jgi:hypothetical protein